MRESSGYVALSAVSGAIWAVMAVILDGATEADHSWAIPWQDPVALSLVLIGGATVGVVIGALVRRLTSACSRIALFLPLLTLPLAISLFALFVWGTRVVLGYHFVPQPLGGRSELSLIVETYLVYGLVSLATPFLYGLALLNQRAIRRPA